MALLRRRIAKSVLLAAAVLWLGASPAGANTYVISPCSVAYTDLRWEVVSAGSGWKLAEECPYRLAVGAAGNAAGQYQWRYPRGSKSSRKIIKAWAWLKGNNGSANGKRQTISVMGHTPYPPDTFDSATPTRFDWSGSQIGSDDWQIWLKGSCINGSTCPGSPALEISNLSIMYDDPVAPVVDSPSALPLDWRFPGGYPALRPGQWHNAISLLSWSAQDSESGVAYTTLNVNDAPVETYDTGCGGPINQFSGFCIGGQSWVIYVNPFDQMRWRQGHNTARITGYDMALNPTVTTVNFNIDTVPPARPVNVSATGEVKNGWHTDRDFDVTWGNPEELEETDFSSGIEHIYYAVTPAEGTVGAGYDGEAPAPGDGLLPNLSIPGDGVWEVKLYAVDRAGNMSEPGEAIINFESLVLDAPRISEIDWVNRDELIGGSVVQWSKPANHTDSRAGICGYAHSIDDHSPGSPGEAIDTVGDVEQLRIRRLLDDGRHHLYLRAISCAGVAGDVTELPFDVDATAPTVNLDPDSGRWEHGGRLAKLGASDAGSGVVSIAYSVDGGPEHVISHHETAIALPHGVHSVTYRAVDLAGNKSDAQTTELRIDEQAPSGAFDQLDPTHPTNVRATVTDADSGIATAWLEYERVDGGAVRYPLISRVTAVGDDVHELSLTGRLPAAQMVAGPHRLKAMVVDRVGNVSSISIHRDGSTAIVVAPLLESPTLTAGFAGKATANRCSSKSGAKKCSRDPAVRTPQLLDRKFVAFGRGARLAGTLAHENGEPVGGTEVSVVATVEGTNLAQPMGQAVTNAKGAFEVRVRRGPSRELEVRYAGSELALPASAKARLFTRATATLTASRRSIGDGDEIALRGRVPTLSAGLPPGGKRVLLEYRSSTGWRLLSSSRTDTAGRFTFRETFGGYDRPVRFAFRVTLEKESGWPFATGHSKVVAVVVRPR